MNPILALVIANAIWGAASPIFKYSLENIPPFTLLFIRFFLATIIFFPFIKTSMLEKLTAKQWLAVIISSLFAFTMHIGFLFLGLERTDSINAPVIISSSPLFIFLFALFFLREKPKMKVLGGMFLSLLGVVVIIFSPIFIQSKDLVSFGELQGNLLYVLATATLVVAVLMHKKLLHSIDPLLLTFVSFFVASVSFLPFSLHELQTWSVSQLDMRGIVGIVYGTVFSSAIAYFCYYYGLSKIKAEEVGIFTYIDPVVAVLIAAPLLHEIPDVFFFIGSVLVFGGIYMGEGRLHWHPLQKLKRSLTTARDDG